MCHPDLDLHWSLRDACWRGRVDVCCFSIKLLGSKLAYLKSLVSHCCTCSATLPFTAPEQVLDFGQRLQDKARKVGVQVTQHQDPGSRKTGSETSRPGTMCPKSNPAEFVVVLEWCMLFVSGSFGAVAAWRYVPWLGDAPWHVAGFLGQCGNLFNVTEWLM